MFAYDPTTSLKAVSRQLSANVQVTGQGGLLIDLRQDFIKSLQKTTAWDHVVHGPTRHRKGTQVDILDSVTV